MVACKGAGITTTVNVCGGLHAVFGTEGTAVITYVPAVVKLKDAFGLFSTVPTDGDVVQSQLKGKKFCKAEKVPLVFSHTESGPEMLYLSSTLMVMIPSPSHSSTSLLM